MHSGESVCLRWFGRRRGLAVTHRFVLLHSSAKIFLVAGKEKIQTQTSLRWPWFVYTFDLSRRNTPCPLIDTHKSPRLPQPCFSQHQDRFTTQIHYSIISIGLIMLMIYYKGSNSELTLRGVISCFNFLETKFLRLSFWDQDFLNSKSRSDLSDWQNWLIFQ